MPYEKIGKNEPVCIADEVPFEIPDSWAWVRFKNLVNYSMGKTPPRKESEYWEKPSFPWVSIADMIDGEVINNSKEQVNQFSFDNVFKGRISPAGTLLMSFKLTVGKVSVLGMDAFHNEAIISIYPYISDNNITRDFLFETLPLLSQAGDTKKAIKGNTLNSDSLDALFIPLPPINEQLRITRKLQELKNPIADYDVLETTSSKLAEDFPESLKKSILQQAVMGKLVPQDPNDEPASVLLDRIRAEKQALIKAGKIKKDKHESIIYRRDNSHYEKLDNVERCIDDEIPFDIPDSWVWTRLKTVGITQTGNTPTKTHQEYFGDDIPFIGPGDIQNACINYCNKGLSALGKDYGRVTTKGSILQVCIGGSIGKAAIALEAVAFNQQINAIYPILIDNDYLYCVMTSPYYIDYMKENAGGTATPIINRSLWDNLLIPIAPDKEQKRIALGILDTFKMIETL